MEKNMAKIGTLTKLIRTLIFFLVFISLAVQKKKIELQKE